MASTTTKPGLPQLSVTDAHHIGVVIAEAQAGLEHAITEVHTLLQQRDLVALQRSLLQLSGVEFGWQHDLSTYVEAQR